MSSGFLVQERIDGAHPKHEDYALLPGDLLLKDPSGWYAKACPGIYVFGFNLTRDQEASLKPVEYTHDHLNYYVKEYDDE